MLFIALVLSTLFYTTEAVGCLSPVNVTTTNSPITFTPNTSISSQCIANIYVNPGYYAKIVSTNSYQLNGDYFGNSYVVEPKWVLNGFYQLVLNFPMFTNSTVSLTVSISQMPTRSPKTVNVVVGAPAQFFDIQTMRNTSYTFQTNSNYQASSVSMSVATLFNSNSLFSELRSCFLIDNYNYSPSDATTRPPQSQSDPNPHTLYDYLGRNTNSHFDSHTNVTITCIEFGNFSATLVVQDVNNLQSVGIYYTYLLSTFSDSIQTTINDQTAVSVFSPNGKQIEINRFFGTTDNCSLHVSDSSPEKSPYFYVKSGSGPFDFQTSIITIKIDPYCSGVVFITSTATQHSFLLAILLLFAWMR